MNVKFAKEVAKGKRLNQFEFLANTNEDRYVTKTKRTSMKLGYGNKGEQKKAFETSQAYVSTIQAM